MAIFSDLIEKVGGLLITPEILSLIAELEEFRGVWRAMSALAPERLSALRKVATIESIGSSTRIEGARLSDREVEALLSRLETSSFASRDEEEVAGYAQAMERVFLSYESISITENYIHQLHSILLRHSSKDEHHRGRYKTINNNVEAFGLDGESLGVVFETASPFDTPFAMRELVEWTQSNLAGDTLHPLIVIAVFVVAFLAIHPFQDGNGRLSRVLTTLLLLKARYSYVPFSSLESIIERNKESYYLALRRTQMSLREDRPDWDPWLVFFFRSLQEQERRLAAKIERSRMMLAGLSALEEAIVELVREQGRIGIAQILAVTGASRGAIKVRLASLVSRGLLTRQGKGRATWYTLS